MLKVRPLPKYHMGNEAERQGAEMNVIYSRVMMKLLTLHHRY